MTSRRRVALVWWALATAAGATYETSALAWPPSLEVSTLPRPPSLEVSTRPRPPSHEASALARPPSPEASALARPPSHEASALTRPPSPEASALARPPSPEASALPRWPSPEGPLLASASANEGAAAPDARAERGAEGGAGGEASGAPRASHTTPDPIERAFLEEAKRPHLEYGLAPAFTAGRGGAVYAGLDLRVALSRWLGPAPSAGREVRDVLLGDTFSVGARARSGTGTNGREAATITHLGLVALSMKRIDSVRVPSLLGLALPEFGFRLRSFGGPRGYVGLNAPFRVFFAPYIFFEAAASLYYLPADGTLDVGLLAGACFR